MYEKDEAKCQKAVLKKPPQKQNKTMWLATLKKRNLTLNVGNTIKSSQYEKSLYSAYVLLFVLSKKVPTCDIWQDNSIHVKKKKRKLK